MEASLKNNPCQTCRLLEAALQRGSRLQTPGEWSRAFLTNNPGPKLLLVHPRQQSHLQVKVTLSCTTPSFNLCPVPGGTWSDGVRPQRAQYKERGKKMNLFDIVHSKYVRLLTDALSWLHRRPCSWRRRTPASHAHPWQPGQPEASRGSPPPSLARAPWRTSKRCAASETSRGGPPCSSRQQQSKGMTLSGFMV